MSERVLVFGALGWKAGVFGDLGWKFSPLMIVVILLVPPNPFDPSNEMMKVRITAKNDP